MPFSGAIRLLCAAAALACVISAATAAEARPRLRGMALGEVVGFDEDRRIVMVDIGSNEGVLKGVTFAVVDARGRQVASLNADEVYDDLFWSGELDISEFRAVRYGMQVRWVFTPETSAVTAARKKGTPEAYRYYLDTYPDGALVTEFVRNMSLDMMEALDPDFNAAWTSYTAESLEEYAAGRTGTALAKAALAEADSIRELKAQAEKERRENEEAAPREVGVGRWRDAGAGAGTVTGGNPPVTDPFNVVFRGVLVNDSSMQVTFEFESPGSLPRTSVAPFSRVEVMHREGVYTYRVYGPRDDFGGMGMDDGFGEPDGFPDDFFGETPAEPAPLKVDSVNIDFDMWEITYP